MILKEAKLENGNLDFETVSEDNLLKNAVHQAAANQLIPVIKSCDPLLPAGRRLF